MTLLLSALACTYDTSLPPVSQSHRSCAEDTDCVLITGCGGCEIDAVNVEFADEYDVSCSRYSGGQCGRSAQALDSASADKWACDWQAVCSDGACEPTCPAR